VKAALADYRTAPISAAEKSLLAFIEQVNADCVSVSAQDIAKLHETGWTDEAIYDAITVCALFNFYNRWIDATGVGAMPGRLLPGLGRSDRAARLRARR